MIPQWNYSLKHLIIKETLDEALAIIAKKELYSKYFDSQNTDKKTINDAHQSKGSNCVDGDRCITE